MALTISAIETKLAAHIEDARKLLDEAVKFVMVIGCKNDKISIKHSAALDCVKKLGMIETAKLDFWKEWE